MAPDPDLPRTAPSTAERERPRLALRTGYAREEFDDFAVDTAPGGASTFWRWYVPWSNWIYLGCFSGGWVRQQGGVRTVCTQLFTLWAAETERQLRERREAEARAEELAQDVLTAAEYAQFKKFGYVDVPSQTNPSLAYRVFGEGRTIVFGEPIGPRSACVVVSPSVVATDALVAKVLAAKYNESKIWAVAHFL